MSNLKCFSQNLSKKKKRFFHKKQINKKVHNNKKEYAVLSSNRKTSAMIIICQVHTSHIAHLTGIRLEKYYLIKKLAVLL